MILNDELKILDDKIKVNEAQYDLGRETAKNICFVFQKSFGKIRIFDW